jgi:uncharacterized iron-regulated protein
MKNPNALHVDFNFLSNILEDKPLVLPSNIDMIYGINGHFLIGEWKKPGEEIKKGQKLLLKSLHKEKNFTVILIEGFSTKEETFVSKFYQVSSNELIYLGNSVDLLKDYIKTWYTLIKHR